MGFLDFEPLVPNPHLLTILGNFWPRNYDFGSLPLETRYIRTEPAVQILVQTQRPSDKARGEVVLLHGLEGSGEAGYIVSTAHAALTAGFVVHRFHMRTCGGTEHLCETLYHAGLTSDLHSFLRQNAAKLPLFLVGFSLGGNVALKATAEAGAEWITGTCTVSAPLDLAACSAALERRVNRLYQDRFVKRMKERLARTRRYSGESLAGCRTIFDIDDRITAPGFGFRDAAHYYETQSALRFVSQIRVPTLMITSQDDPLIPFAAYKRPEVRSNTRIEVIAPAHGGHLGFLSRRAPRFWTDKVILDWISQRLAAGAC